MFDSQSGGLDVVWNPQEKEYGVSHVNLASYIFKLCIRICTWATYWDFENVNFLTFFNCVNRLWLKTETQNQKILLQTVTLHCHSWAKWSFTKNRSNHQNQIIKRAAINTFHFWFHMVMVYHHLRSTCADTLVSLYCKNVRKKFAGLNHRLPKIALNRWYISFYRNTKKTARLLKQHFSVLISHGDGVPSPSLHMCGHFSFSFL